MNTTTLRLMVMEADLDALAARLAQLTLAAELDVLAGATPDDPAPLLEGPTPPDAVLLCGAAAVAAADTVRGRWPQAHLVVLHPEPDPQVLLQALEAGACGVLSTEASPAELVTSLREVQAGGGVLTAVLTRQVLDALRGNAALTQAFAAPATPEVHLTARETEILQVVAKGLSNREAAEVFGVSRATVRTHLEHVFLKLEVNSRTEAVTEALRMGLIEL